MKSFISLFLIVIFLVSCQPIQNKDSSNNSLDRIIDQKVLKVGYIVFPPAISKDPNTNELSGHFVDTINEIADQINVEVEFIETEWSTFTLDLNSNRFDVSIAPTFITIPRAKEVTFSDPLFYAGNSAIVKTGETRFSSIESIDKEGVTVAVTIGEAGQEYADKNFTKATIKKFPNTNQATTFQTVISGQADIALGDAYATSQFASNNLQVEDLFKSNPYNLTPVAWAIKKGNTQLLEFVNQSISVLDSQGKLIEFEKKAGANWLHLKTEYILTNE